MSVERRRPCGAQVGECRRRGITIKSLDAVCPRSLSLHPVTSRSLTKRQPTPKRASLRFVRSLTPRLSWRNVSVLTSFRPGGDRGHHAGRRSVRSSTRRLPGFCSYHDRCSAWRRPASALRKRIFRAIPPPGKDDSREQTRLMRRVSVWCGATLGWRDSTPRTEDRSK